MRALSPRDALLLLPSLSAPVAVLGPPGVWPAALADWQLWTDRTAPRVVVVTAGARVAARCGADVVLLDGPDRRHELRRAGYDVTVWWSHRTADGGAVAGVGSRPGRLRGRPGVARREVLRGPGVTTVAARGGSEPGVLSAVGTRAARARLTVSDDPRRRAVFRVTDGNGVLRSVVKVTRSPGEQERPAVEQRVLRTLRSRGLSSGLPEPLGQGRLGPLAWSAESGAAGTPLQTSLDRGPHRAATVLTGLARWLEDLAATTVGRPCWLDGRPEDALALRGDAEQERPLLGQLTGIPGVLAHGDLASGINVLVGPDGTTTVLDWETARWGALPLLDLVPLLCLGLVRGRTVCGPEAEAAGVMALARGHHPDSGLLLRLVREHACRLSLPPSAIGPLALLAWAYQASMRAVHAELLTAAGLLVPSWVSTAELVLPAWRADRSLGHSWPAAAGT